MIYEHAETKMIISKIGTQQCLLDEHRAHNPELARKGELLLILSNHFTVEKYIKVKIPINNTK